jgi:chemotaxis protein histidine kinase CheA
VSREITELAADAETTSDDLDLALKELDGLTSRQSRLGNELQDKLVAMRLVPLSSLANRLHRTARSVALKQDKELELVVPGGQTELDKRVLEELGSVLLHLIRNAVDHGLESPEERSRLASRSWGPCACALPGSAVRR